MLLNKIVRIKFINLLLAFVLIASLFLRLTTFQYPYEKNDTRRDHLIARHIIKYHEFPKIGVINAFSGEKHSPVYFYFLALLLLPNDSFFFLGIENIILQTLTIFIIYELARRLYGTQTALLASVLFSFNLYAIHQSAFIWMAWSMQFFSYLSYLLLLLAHLKKNYYYLLLSVLLFIFAGALHPSVFTLSPFFLILIIMVLRNQNATIKYYIGLVVPTLLSLTAYFLPVTLFRIYADFTAKNTLTIEHLDSPARIIPNFINNIPYFLGSILFDAYSTNKLINILSLVICFILTYYLLFIKNKKEKFFSYLIITSCFLIILMISFFEPYWYRSLSGSHYFATVFGLFIILLSRALLFVFAANARAKIIGVFFLSIYLGAFFSFVYSEFYKKYHPFTIHPPNIAPITAIKQNIITLKEENNYTDYGFFSLVAHADGFDGWIYTPTVWAILEEELDAKLVTVDDEEEIGFKPISENPDYIFLVCPNSITNLNKKRVCVNKFMDLNKSYSFEKETFSQDGFAVAMIKKIN